MDQKSESGSLIFFILWQKKTCFYRSLVVPQTELLGSAGAGAVSTIETHRRAMERGTLGAARK